MSSLPSSASGSHDDVTITAASESNKEGEPIFEWYAAHSSDTQIPKWVKERIDPKYLDKSKYFGRLYYCKFGAPMRKRSHNGKIKEKEEIDLDLVDEFSLQIRCPWKRYCVWPLPLGGQQEKKFLKRLPFSLTIVTLYFGVDFCGNESISPWDHAEMNPEHRPLKIEKIQNHPIWIADDVQYIQNHTPAERLQHFKEKVNASSSFSNVEKTLALQLSSTRKVKEHARYARKKSILNDPSQCPWDLNRVLQSPYVGAVILKTSVDDDSLSFSLYSKKIIDFVNHCDSPLQFFCDGSFSFVNHLQLLIIGTRMTNENAAYKEFFPFAILITNRKTTSCYQRFFQELKTSGKWEWKNDLFSGMTDMELGISNAAKLVFPNSTWHLCWFHVSQNIIAKIDELKFPTKRLQFLIFGEIKKIHQCTSLRDAKRVIRAFKNVLDKMTLDDLKAKFSQFLQYCETYYWSNDDTLERWITHLNIDGKPIDATNNYIERFNHHFASIIFRKKKLRKVEKAIKILNDHFAITEQTLGLVPSRPFNNICTTTPQNPNELQGFVASTKGLASYINEMMGSKLGGKKKPKKTDFMDPPHHIPNDDDTTDTSSSLSHHSEKDDSLSADEDEVTDGKDEFDHSLDHEDDDQNEDFEDPSSPILGNDDDDEMITVTSSTSAIHSSLTHNPQHHTSTQSKRTQLPRKVLSQNCDSIQPKFSKSRAYEYPPEIQNRSQWTKELYRIQQILNPTTNAQQQQQ